ncbi:MAG TPA: hypothetical protein VJM08_12320, partial [Anaerolineales bacterium]|nr:hypothetical protein [Anaerolineales bacterium]
MRLKIPDPSDELVPSDLKKLLDEADVEWQKPSSKRPDLPNLCPPATDRKKKTLAPKKSPPRKHLPLPPPPPIADRWLTIKFNRMVLDLAIHLNLNQQAKAALVQALVDANLQVPTISTATRALTPVQSKTPSGGKRITGQIQSSEINRREACEIISKYLEPLLDADKFTLWLTEMARSQWSWRGGDPNSPSVPFPVRQREARQDRQLLIDWFAAPQAPKFSPSELARAQALVESEPIAPGALTSSRGTMSVLPLIVIRGQPVPANLFISDVSVPIAGYLTLLEIVLRAGASVLDLHIPLMGVAYGMLALALVPVYCLYDNYHGTCTIETLLPILSQSIAALREYPNGLLQAALSPGIDRKLLMVEDPGEAAALQTQVKLVFDAFGSWAKSLADAIERSHQTLLFIAGEQSGGRVRTPTQFSSSGQWDFPIQRTMNDGSTEPLVLNAPELLAYTTVEEGGKRISQREHPNFAEIFWLLRAIWEPVATAAALINQAGFTFWINAANNRWGGNHPPHKSHRQGNSLDFDVGFG